MEEEGEGGVKGGEWEAVEAVVMLESDLISKRKRKTFYITKFCVYFL